MGGLAPAAMTVHAQERQFDQQRRFVADAAHELRSPLTALKLQLQLAERSTSQELRAASFRKLHERVTD